MSKPFDPYQKWLGIPPQHQPPHHYRLLGIELFEPDSDTIAYAADRQMAHVRSFQSGEHAPHSQRLLNEIATAKLQLLNPEKRATYDAQLRAQIMLNGADPNLASGEGAAPRDAEGSLTGELLRSPAILAGLAVCGVLGLAIIGLLVMRSMPRDGTPEVAVVDPANSTNTTENSNPDGSTNPPAENPPGGTGAGDENPKVDSADDASTNDAAVAKEDEKEKASDPPAEVKPKAVDPMPAVKEQPPVEPDTTDESTVGTKQPPLKPAVKQGSVKEATDDDPADATTPEDSVPMDDAPEDDGEKPAETVVAKGKSEDNPTDPDDRRTLESLNNQPTAKPNTSPFDPPVPKEPQPVPSNAEITKAVEDVRSIFAKEYAAAKTPDEKNALAMFLLREAAGLDTDPVGRFAMLSESRDQAEAAGNYAGAIQTVMELAREYKIDALSMKVQILATAAKKATTAQAKHALATMAIKLSDEASQARRFDVAEKLVAQAGSMAQRVGDVNLRTQARNSGVEVKKRKAQWAVVEKAIETLKKLPNDPEANLIYGKHLCLVEHEWEQGLPLLAKGSDAKLKEAAQLDLAEPTDSHAQVAVGDAWFELADSDEELADLRIREHVWYLKALPTSAGLTRAKVEKRLRENPKVQFRRQWLDTPATSDGEKEEESSGESKSGPSKTGTGKTSTTKTGEKSKASADGESKSEEQKAGTPQSSKSKSDDSDEDFPLDSPNNDSQEDANEDAEPAADEPAPKKPATKPASRTSSKTSSKSPLTAPSKASAKLAP